MKHLYRASRIAAYARLLLFLAAAASALSLARAQAPPAGTATCGISGRLIDPGAAPVAYATVALMRADSTLLRGEITDDGGAFAFEGLEAGAYLLQAQSLEFETRTVAVRATVLPKGVPAEPLEMVLTPRAHDLASATVTARRALVELKSDRMVYNVSSSPSASGATVLDVLRGAPGVQIDLDNAIQLQGKSGVQVYINGRPTRLAGADLAALLQSMPSDNVEAIDLITNPSARFEAEGGAGVIDIRLKRNVATGVKGRLFAGGSKGLYYKSANGLSLNYGAERMRANLDLTHNYDTYLFNLVESRRQEGMRIERDSYERSVSRPSSAAVGAEFQLAPKHSLSAATRATYTTQRTPIDNVNDVYDAGGRLRRVLLADTELEGTRVNLTGDLGYRHEPGEGQVLSADVSFVRFDKDESNDQPNVTYAPDRTTVVDRDYDVFDARSSIGLYSAKADYERAWSRARFGAGAKYVDVTSDNDLAYFDVEAQGPVHDPERSNRFTYDERVVAAYATGQASLGAAATLDVGLRVEATRSRGQLHSARDLDDRDVRRRYVDYFPNVGLSHDAGGDHAWSLSVGRRLNRPNYQDLNPFAFPQSKLFIWQGNPFLQPRYTFNYQLNYTYKKQLAVAGSYTVERDFFARVFEPLGEEVTRIIPRNMRRATSLGATVSYPRELATGWDVVAFGSLFYRTYDGEFGETVIGLDNVNWEGRLQTTVRLPLGILADLAAGIQSENVWRGSVVVQGNPYVNVGLKRAFLSDKLELRFTGADIFRSTSVYHWAMDYGGIVSSGTATFDFRRFGINASYSFGNDAVRKRRSGGALDEELDRL